MTRIVTLTLTFVMFAGSASTQPLALSNDQLDRVSAGSLSLSLSTLASLQAPWTVSLPGPIGTLLTVSQAAVVMINVNASSQPAVASVTNPEAQPTLPFSAHSGYAPSTRDSHSPHH